MDNHLSYKLLHRWIKVLAVVLIPLLTGPFVLKRWFFPAPSAAVSSNHSHVPADGRLQPHHLPLMRRPEPADPAARYFTVYRWTDENGVWHYADHPRSGENVESVVMDREEGLVVLPGRKTTPIVPAEIPPRPVTAKEDRRTAAPLEEPIPTLLNPLRIKARAEEAKAAIEAHYERQQEALAEVNPR